MNGVRGQIGMKFVVKDKWILGSKVSGSWGIW